MRAAPERDADVGQEHPHVGTAGARDPEVDVGPVHRGQLERVDADRAGRRLEDLAAPGRLVQLAAADLHRRVRGRHLERIAQQRRHRVADVGLRGRHRPFDRDLAVGVERGGLDPQPRGALIGLGERAEEAQQPRRPTDARGRAGRSPSDRASRRVPPCACRGASAPRRRRRATSSLAACRRGAALRVGSRNGGGLAQRGDQPRDRSRRTVLRRVAGREPVSAAAEGGGDRREVVRSPRERVLTLNRPSCCCLSTAATSTSRTVRIRSIRSSVSPAPTPAPDRSAWVRYVQTRSASGTNVALESAIAETRRKRGPLSS